MKSKIEQTQIKNGDAKETASSNTKHELNRSFGVIDLWNRQKKHRPSFQTRRHII